MINKILNLFMTKMAFETQYSQNKVLEIVQNEIDSPSDTILLVGKSSQIRFEGNVNDKKKSFIIWKDFLSGSASFMMPNLDVKVLDNNQSDEKTTLDVTVRNSWNGYVMILVSLLISLTALNIAYGPSANKEFSGYNGLIVPGIFFAMLIIWRLSYARYKKTILQDFKELLCISPK